jgi:membrane protein implicated in regulation of membrane protease activity
MAERPSDDQRNSATFAALAMLVLISGGLLALVAFVLPDVLWIVVVVLGLGLSVVLHYLVWGRWLTSFLRDQEANEQRQSDHEESDVE